MIRVSLRVVVLLLLATRVSAGPAFTFLKDTKVDGVWDKGADKGAILVGETVISDKKTGDKLCTMQGTTGSETRGDYAAPKRGWVTWWHLHKASQNRPP